MTSLGNAAGQLAADGYHVFPLAPRAKRPITSNGFKAATRDARHIADWWRRAPGANIGIACGAAGIAVLDIDTKFGADPRRVLARFDRAGAPVIGTGLAPAPSRRYPASLAGRRGVQVYFRGCIPSAARLTIEGCEIKSQGGYVVAPPSVHPCGVEYVGDLPPVEDLPPVPAWLLELVPRAAARPAAAPYRATDPSRALAGLARTVAQSAPGGRNRALFWGVCRAAEHVAAGDMDEGDAVAELRAAALHVGLEDAEITATIRSGFRLAGRAAA